MSKSASPGTRLPPARAEGEEKTHSHDRVWDLGPKALPENDPRPLWSIFLLRRVGPVQRCSRSPRRRRPLHAQKERTAAAAPARGSSTRPHGDRQRQFFSGPGPGRGPPHHARELPVHLRSGGPDVSGFLAGRNLQSVLQLTSRLATIPTVCPDGLARRRTPEAGRSRCHQRPGPASFSLQRDAMAGGGNHGRSDHHPAPESYGRVLRNGKTSAGGRGNPPGFGKASGHHHALPPEGKRASVRHHDI